MSPKSQTQRIVQGAEKKKCVRDQIDTCHLLYDHCTDAEHGSVVDSLFTICEDYSKGTPPISL